MITIIEASEIPEQNELLILKVDTGIDIAHHRFRNCRFEPEC
jgi:tRNA-binding EMAP/Myf-like protein